MECILSVLPFCDKVLLNDGGSTDGTKEYLQKLENKSPEKIKLYYIKDRYTKNWKSIDYGLNELIKKCKSDWIFEIQGDEILDTENAFKMIKVIKKSKNYNAIRHSRLDYDFVSEDFFYDMRTVRIVRNIPDLTSYTGGDNFQIGSRNLPREGFTLHNVPPERDDYSFVLKHYFRCFPDCVGEWARRHAKDLASDNSNRQDLYKNTIYPSFSDKKNIPSHVPVILTGLVGENSYKVRVGLLDDG